MYNTYFGLTSTPFNLTADPGFLYLTNQHKEALVGLAYAIYSRKGFVVLASEAGMGKTTLLGAVLRHFHADRINSSVILNPTLTAGEFLELALMDFGLVDIPASKALRLDLLHRMLLRTQQEGKVAVLFIDEAHKLSPEVLEEVRLLSNFEMADQKLLQIVLSGQKELSDTLDRPELWQLKQRVALRMTLLPLIPGEVERYIQHRWVQAGGVLPTPFGMDTVPLIAEFSRGIPRVINVICDNALTLAFADGTHAITPDHILKVGVEFHLSGDPTPAVKPVEAPPETVAPAAVISAPVAPGPVLQTLERYDSTRKTPSRWSRWFRKPTNNLATTEHV